MGDHDPHNPDIPPPTIGHEKPQTDDTKCYNGNCTLSNMNGCSKKHHKVTVISEQNYSCTIYH